MTATIELNLARRKLQNALGENTQEYFRHMKTWFRKRCSKEEFDAEARKLLPIESSHLHNEFLLAILNKCQTLASFTTLSNSSTSSLSPTKASSPASCMSPNAINPNNGSGTSGGVRKQDLGDSGRLRYGPVKRKSKSNRPSFDQRFQSPPLTNGLSVCDAGSLDLREEDERKLMYAFREPTLPDSSCIHGRMLVSAWEAGLEIGVDDDAVNMMVNAVEQFLRNLIGSLLMDRSGYRLRNGRVPFAIGEDTPNPWLLNTQRRAKGPRVEVVSDVVSSDNHSNENAENENEIIPLVPIGERMLKDVEHAALMDVACASGYDNKAGKSRGLVSLFDLMHTLQKNRSLIPSHTVYSLNMERLISRISHPGHDD